MLNGKFIWTRVKKRERDGGQYFCNTDECIDVSMYFSLNCFVFQQGGGERMFF